MPKLTVSELDTKNNVQISDKNDIKAIMEALYNLNYKDPDDKNTAFISSLNIQYRP